MGIRGLTPALQRYGVLSALGGESVVIDGPALVHRILTEFPAVIEALTACEDWGPLIQVVPGEADTFCARDVRQNGGIVLTSDSDLLIQDLGPDGRVSFFWNIVYDRSSGIPALSASTFSFHGINDQLGIKEVGGLPRVVFEQIKGRLGFEEAVEKAKNDTQEVVTSLDYLNFMKEYQVDECIPADRSVLNAIVTLDPRISEIVIQTLLATTLKELRERLPSPEMLWLAFAIMEDVESSASDERTSLSVTVLSQASSAFEDVYDCSWDFIHYTAQIQASYYSLRILKQILDVVVALKQDLPKTFAELRESLISLPTIAEWPTFGDMSGLLSDFASKEILTTVTDILGIPPIDLAQVAAEGTKSKKKKKKTRKQKQDALRDTMQRNGKRSPSLNPFAILSQASQE
ncbi:hypothetical protein DL764_004410 [Monosporascus ibericus]|uniref:Asteroid domain-containing protein n=1 Tax=Monosporascus ibericus TaxID=155417 RepID=A0A4V1XAZ9_9PEZI|nr:hypothetical protein DL764_004410 [Monosporascus ibericus]